MDVGFICNEAERETPGENHFWGKINVAKHLIGSEKQALKLLITVCCEVRLFLVCSGTVSGEKKKKTEKAKQLSIKAAGGENKQCTE